MQGNTFKVFVYGTLLRGEYNHRVAAPYLLNVEKGSVKGHLFSVGPFPALVADENGNEVIGEWFTVTEEGLHQMDRLEGFVGEGCSYNHYERIKIKDANKNIEGYVYVYTKEKAKHLEPIKSNSWRAYRKVTALS